VTMMAPKISAISEDFAFDRITSSIGLQLLGDWCEPAAKLPYPRPLGKLDTLEKPGERCKGKNGGGRTQLLGKDCAPSGVPTAQVGSILKRFREPIFVVALLAIPFVLFFVKAKKGIELNRVDRALIALMAPVERTITGVAFGLVDAWRGYVALRSVRTENLALRRENLRARATDQQAAELKLENERLRHLLEFADKEAPTRLVIAKVVAVGASPHSHTLRIARGTDDGVVKGAAVIAPDGIVGTVAQLTGSYADVQLIVSPLSAVPAITQRTRSRSTVKGTGDIGRCKLEYALRSDDLVDGDMLITASGPGFFPPGLRIGRVANVSRKQSGMFLAAEVVPAVDFSRLDEVSVVAAAEPVQQASDLAPSTAGTAQ
jgi:rod shape-determining protein MreC